MWTYLAHGYLAVMHQSTSKFSPDSKEDEVSQLVVGRQDGIETPAKGEIRCNLGISLGRDLLRHRCRQPQGRRRVRHWRRYQGLQEGDLAGMRRDNESKTHQSLCRFGRQRGSTVAGNDLEPIELGNEPALSSRVRIGCARQRLCDSQCCSIVVIMLPSWLVPQ
jgi:hypothetical protein